VDVAACSAPPQIFEQRKSESEARGVNKNIYKNAIRKISVRLGSIYQELVYLWLQKRDK
jgi:hypothetical protein